MSAKVSTTVRIDADKYKRLKHAILDLDDKGLQALIDKWIDEYLERWQQLKSND